MIYGVDKPVIIQLTSTQWTNGERMPSIHLTTEGQLSEQNGTWAIRYDESEATGMAGTKTKISLAPSGAVRLERRGEIEMDIVFREGQNHLSQIAMPYGTLNFQLTTSEARGRLNAEGGNVSLAYSLAFDKSQVISTNLSLVVRASEWHMPG